MKTLHYTVKINAPKEKVWDAMLQDKTYREWTAVFNPLGSYFEGNWEKGSKMRFLGPDKDGNLGGISSEIAENRPYEFVSIQHLAEIRGDGKETTESEFKAQWGDARENYSFNESDGVTEVTVDLSSSEEFADYFDEAWPKALQKLKEIAER